MSKRGSKSLKPWERTQNCQIPVLVTSLILLVVASVYLFYKKGDQVDSSFGQRKQNSNTFPPSVQFYPNVDSRNGTDVIWQIPDSPKAILFVAHGCNGRAGNFWDKSPDCTNCVGLPEERLIVLHALARKFAVLTISSFGRCWSFGKERLIVKEIIKWWIEKNNLEKLPLVALGASSGGYFVSVLATELSFHSITLMIAAGMFDQIDVSEDYPPTLFVHMPKDQYREKKIYENMETLKKKGINVAEIKCLEFPLSPTFLSDRLPGLGHNISTNLFELFQEKGFIDENGYMKNDGRATRWKKAVKERKTLLFDKFWIGHIQEELNLAFAYHEMTSLQSEQIFRWFEYHMS